ncbi:glycosyltransferase family 4 protein [Sphingomicrobium clamense]|uniref:Glycosyltransferase family 4 protein n=1 Tax=Sphingomicrobium clamense TaxID=2851013 RepID=A0ABS6V735_9SPHN|nr:glycosyltransferase family 4 protein [Sphingomicrobium sp. B8]MBW0145286.1 glycosyltransferase family 4 protein [Sphingomicrobium sp. B8]
MKILVLANIPDELAGARLHLLTAMVERGHEVVAAAPDLEAHQAAGILAGNGVKCAQFSLSRTGLNPLREWRTLQDITALMRDHYPDVTYAMTIKPVIYGTMAAANAGVPRRFAHITGLGYAFTGPRTGKRAIIARIVENLYRRSLRQADTVFFENEDDRDLFLSRDLIANARKASVIDGSGIDLDHFTPAPWPDGPIRFLFVGRLLKSKGLPELIEAMRRVRQEHPETRLTIVGPLDENPDAIDRVEFEGWVAEGVVEYRGKLDDVRSELTKSHVFVLPSHREGLPRSTMEAMATGRAIITTDAPGCRRTVEHGGNGLLVPVGGAEALAAAITEMIKDPDRAREMGESSLQLVRERFSVERINAQLLDAMGL